MSEEQETPVVVKLDHTIGIAHKDHPILRTQLDPVDSGYLDKPTVSRGVTLENFEGEILDQGQTGSCTGHGTSQALTVSYGAAQMPLPFRPSPKLLYELGRILDRQTPADGLQDNGAMPARIMQALQFWGIHAMLVDLTSDGRISDVTPDNVNDEPSLLELEDSGLKLVAGEYRIDETSSTFGDQITAALAGGTGRAPAALGVGMFVDTQNFMAYDGTKPITTIDTRDPQGGGHWLAVSYFYYDTTLGLIIGGPNSWGKSWGKNGHYEIAVSCMQSVTSDLYIINANAFTMKVAA